MPASIPSMLTTLLQSMGGAPIAQTNSETPSNISLALNAMTAPPPGEQYVLEEHHCRNHPVQPPSAKKLENVASQAVPFINLRSRRKTCSLRGKSTSIKESMFDDWNSVKTESTYVGSETSIDLLDLKTQSKKGGKGALSDSKMEFYPQQWQGPFKGVRGRIHLSLLMKDPFPKKEELKNVAEGY